MTSRTRAIAWLAMTVYFGACLLLAARIEASRGVTAAAAWGMGASLDLSVAWWWRAERERRR